MSESESNTWGGGSGSGTLGTGWGGGTGGLRTATPAQLGEPYYDPRPVGAPGTGDVINKPKRRKNGIDPAFAKQYWEDNPLGAYYAMFPQAGEDTPFGNWLRNSYSRYFAKYNAALPVTPNLTFYDFLTRQNMQQDFNDAPVSARSLRGFMVQPKVRYIGF